MYPEDLKYSKEHEWAKIEGDTATIGISHHAQDSLGDIVYVELPQPGKEIKALQELGVVESVKTVSTIYAPVGGTVIAVNSDLSGRPELVNQDPYGKGWMVKIKLSNPSEADKLMPARDYQAFLESSK